MMATANNNDINVFSVGTSPNKDQVNIPKQSVVFRNHKSHIPKFTKVFKRPFSRIPKQWCITTDKPMTNTCDFKNLTSGQT